jgi:hypothetical protein
MNKEQKDLLDEMYNDIGIDISYDMENNKPDTMDELRDMLQDRISEIEVIYYANAMEYLSENDNSLTESLTMAHDFGYTADKINSELLATILKQENARNEIGGYEDRLEELFYSENEIQ